MKSALCSLGDLPWCSLLLSALKEILNASPLGFLWDVKDILASDSSGSEPRTRRSPELPAPPRPTEAPALRSAQAINLKEAHAD